jgi:SAM-dependent methyltransferase
MGDISCLSILFGFWVNYNTSMDPSITRKLLALNAEFYQTFAIQFSDTRQRIQPGVLRVLDTFPDNANILDLGCGNGELAQNLAQGDFRGSYLGLDFSSKLLEVARAGVADMSNFQFIQGNLGQPDWQSVVSQSYPKFDLVLAFASLHHLPGRATHLQILGAVREFLVPDGSFIHSNWQFLNSDRLRKRVHDWNEIGLSAADVEPGDYLLDWRRGGFGLRYVHHFSEDELQSLAEETGFTVVQTFYSDGENGNLGLYQVWKV